MGLSRERLGEKDLASALAKLPAWTVENGAVTRLFEFSSYKEGLVFACAVGWAADAMDHHPDLFVGYRQVRVSSSTHTAGGVTALDIELARKVDSLAS